MLDQLFEIKTCRNKNTLQGHSFCSKECEGLFANIDPKQNMSLINNESTIAPLEMGSVHIEIKEHDRKFGFLNILKKKNKK